MTARIKSVPAHGEFTVRKRKAHKKSRLGCRNCKLRRVKCSEARPFCTQCLDFGVLCNYDCSIPDLQPLSAASNVVRLDAVIDKSPLLTTEPFLDLVNTALEKDSLGSNWKSKVLRFDGADLARLDRFQKRTVLTIGVRRVARVFQSRVVHIACTHRFLMHLIQVVTASHDRYLCGSSTARPSRAEAYHLSQALATFQTILSRPIHPEDRDALMVASSLLGVVSFFNLEATSVEEVWPLVDSDMSWLNLTDGKRAVWRLLEQPSPGSLWEEVASMYNKDQMPPADMPPHTPSVFDHLCSDDPLSPSAAANPYYQTSRALVALLDLECDDSTWLQFLGFLYFFDPPFKSLLEARDPWALLILCYWYMKVCKGSWWVSSRGILQGQAICLYLERYHSKDHHIQMALSRPRMEFEAAQMEGWGGISSTVSSPGSVDSLKWP